MVERIVMNDRFIYTISENVNVKIFDRKGKYLRAIRRERANNELIMPNDIMFADESIKNKDIFGLIKEYAGRKFVSLGSVWRLNDEFFLIMFPTRDNAVHEYLNRPNQKPSPQARVLCTQINEWEKKNGIHENPYLVIVSYDKKK